MSALATRDGGGDGGLVVLAPLSVEARAARAGAPSAQVHRIGMGPRRAARSAQLAGEGVGGALLIAGFCGALDPDLEPGDVVLATELRGPTGTTAWLAPAVRDRPLAALRVVVDTHRHELHRPLRTVAGAAAAYRALRRACGLAEGWARALGSREVVLAAPRASCAGVERAVEVVEQVLEQRGAPVYVRKQIVHNASVVASLEERGAVFVDDVDEAPRGATVIFSAHGVSPAVRAEAADRELDAIDATCPLVSKVHAEARRFASAGYDIVLVGHEGHEEVEGTFGEAPERTHVVADVEAVEALEVEDPDRVAYLTQTTLAIDETAAVVEALRARFPSLVGPASSDICYATQNRQDAVRAVAAECDLVLVVGSGNSSNSRRLVEVAERAGCPAALVEDAGAIPPELLVGAHRVGLTAGASAPETLVEDVVRALDGLGGASVSERAVALEDVSFRLPPEVR